MSFMGLDIGPEVCTALVASRSGDVLSRRRDAYPAESRAAGWVELDCENVWEKARAVMRHAAREAAAQGDPVECLAPSTFGEAVIPLDSSGSPLSFSPLAADQRGLEDIRAFGERVDAERIFRITGTYPGPAAGLAKLLYWKRAESLLFDTAHSFACWEDFIIRRLSGRSVIDPSLASRTLLFDIREGAWSAELLAASGIGEERLSAVAASGSAVAEIEAATARSEDLEELVGCVVATGGWDQACAALGSGVLAEGEALDNTAATECLAVPVRRLANESALQDGHFQVIPHVAGGCVLVSSGTLAAGALLEWFGRLCTQPSGTELSALIESLPSGPSGIIAIPHFSGAGTPLYDEQARGILWGLTLDTTREEVLKALMEGLCFELKRNIEYLRYCGIPLEILSVTGGASRSDFWVSLKATVTGCRCQVPQITDAAAFGAALLAGVACGKLSGADSLRELATRGMRVTDPEPELAELYEAAYGRYWRVEEAFSGAH
jgi:xylulokinase